MAVYDDVERCKCGHCGFDRDVRSMSCMAGVWICMTCYEKGKRTARTTLAELTGGKDE